MRPIGAISKALAWHNAGVQIDPLSVAAAMDLDYTATGWKLVEVYPGMSHGVAAIALDRSAIGKAAEGVYLPYWVMEKAEKGGFWAKEKVEEGVVWAAENPVGAACIVVAVGGLIIVVAPSIATSPMLAVLGIGSKGPIAG
jgi:hypothetical protein